MATDPVCSMHIENEKTAEKMEYMGAGSKLAHEVINAGEVLIIASLCVLGVASI